MRYYKQVKNGGVVLIGTGPGGIEITQAEYEALLAEAQEKARLADALYVGEISIADVQEAWREDIQHRVADREAADEAAKNADISGAELGGMLEAIL